MMERFELRKARLAQPAAGIRCGRYLAFNRAAVDKLLRQARNAEVFFDVVERKIGFKFLSQPSAFSYRVSVSGPKRARKGAPARRSATRPPKPWRRQERAGGPQNAAINCPTFLRHCGAPRTQKPRPLVFEHDLWTLKLSGAA